MVSKDARSLPSVTQEDIRRKATKAVLSGMSRVAVARVFGVTRQSVGKWVKAHGGHLESDSCSDCGGICKFY